MAADDTAALWMWNTFQSVTVFEKLAVERTERSLDSVVLKDWRES